MTHETSRLAVSFGAITCRPLESYDRPAPSYFTKNTLNQEASGVPVHARPTSHPAMTIRFGKNIPVQSSNTRL